MKNLFRVLILLASAAMVYVMISKNVPGWLGKQGLPEPDDLQTLVENTISANTSKTVSLGEDNIGTLFYLGNNEIETDKGKQPLETEIVSRSWGGFGIEIDIRSIIENNDTAVPDDKRTTRVDSSGRRAKVVMYEVKDRRRVCVDNSWIMVERAGCYSYIAEVRMLNNQAETTLLLELLMEKGVIEHPLIGVKLLKVKPVVDGYTGKAFVFDDKRSFAYTSTIFKAIRSGLTY